MKTTRWNPRNQPIVLGVSLDGREDALIQNAAALARALDSPLHIVHATQPIFNYMGAGDVVVNPYYGYDRVINDMEDEQARKSLEKLRKTLSDLKVETLVVRDYTSEALTTVAKDVHAGLIVTGLRNRASGNFFEGMSTAFSLAAHADCPLMIMPLDTFIDFAADNRLLVADNMELEGHCALEAAIQLGIELQSKGLGHMHVHTLAHSEVAHMVDKVREAMNLGRIPLNPDFSANSYLEEMRSKIAADLQSRFRSLPGSDSIVSRYEAIVSFGKPVDELHKTTQLLKPQLLIFGRHHLFHRQRFSLGKIPYDAMMEDGVATMIVPDYGRG